MSAATPAPADLTLRPLRWTDIPRLAQLELDLFGVHAWTAQVWWAELAARPRRDYIVATPTHDPVDGLIGYAGLDLAGDTADVMTVAVAPAYRGRGVGHRLVGWLVERARERGAATLLLEVRADNAAALALYRREGFVELTVRRRYYQPGDVDALVLRRSLRADSPGAVPSPSPQGRPR
jgi:ribosomal-protein-alanine N-acetyltransferase